MNTKPDKEILRQFPQERIVNYGGRALTQVPVEEMTAGLNRKQMEFEVDTIVFNLPEEVKSEKARIISQIRSIQPSARFLDDNLWRLSEFELKDHIMRFGRTRYSDYVATNLAALYGISTRKGKLLSILEGGPRLSQLRYSRAANPLGVAAMVTTSENSTFLQNRSSQTLTYPNMVGPSVSGTLECVPSLPDPFMAIMREISQELGIEPWEILTIKYIGLTRDLKRAGQPDMFFIVKTELSLDTILKRVDTARDKYETDSILPISHVEIMSEEHFTFPIANSQITPTALMACYLLSKHLTTCRLG